MVLQYFQFLHVFCVLQPTTRGATVSPDEKHKSLELLHVLSSRKFASFYSED
jgi:hypothetical protein